MFLELSYKTTGRTSARLRKPLAVLLILSLCILALVAREARAQEPPREDAPHQRSAAKPPVRTAKHTALAVAQAGTTSAEAPPAASEPVPETSPPAPEPVPETPPSAPEPVAYEPAAYEPASEAPPTAYEPASEAPPPPAYEPAFEAPPAAYEPASRAPPPVSEPTFRLDTAGGYDAEMLPGPYPAEIPGFEPVEGVQPEPEERYLAVADERIADLAFEAPPAGISPIKTPLVETPPDAPVPAGRSGEHAGVLPRPEPVLLAKNRSLSPAPLLTASPPSRTREVPAPRPVVPAPRQEAPRPLPKPEAVVQTLQNTVNALGQLADGAFLQSVAAEVDWGSTGAVLADLFSGAQAALTPAGEYTASPEPPSSAPGIPSDDGAPQQPLPPFTLPPLGGSSFSLLPGGGEIGPGGANPLLLLGVLAAGLVLLRWDGRLYRVWSEPPRLGSVLLPALEHPG